MDGLRGIAMLFVFLGHFGSLWTDSPHPPGAPDFFLKIIDADATFGSSFFMLLSGFFAYGSLMRGASLFKFLRGRLWRLYPLYLLMNLAYIAGFLLFPAHSKLPSTPFDIAIYLIETILFLPGILHVAPIMEVAWTLSFVVYFYFIEAACAFAFKRLQAPRAIRFAILCSFAGLWIYCGQSFGWWQHRTVAFWVGMALLEAVEAFSANKLALAAKLVVPAAIITVLGVWLRTYLALRESDPASAPHLVDRTVITSITLFAFVWIARFGPVWWKRLLSSKHLCQLGAASYSFYLTHGFAVKAFRYVVIPWLGPATYLPAVFWVSQFLGLTLAVYVSRVAFALVENPLSKLAPKPFGDFRGAATPT